MSLKGLSSSFEGLLDAWTVDLLSGVSANVSAAICDLFCLVSQER